MSCQMQCQWECHTPSFFIRLGQGWEPTKVEGKSQSEGKALPLAHSGPMSMGKTEGGAGDTGLLTCLVAWAIMQFQERE